MLTAEALLAGAATEHLVEIPLTLAKGVGDVRLHEREELAVDLPLQARHGTVQSALSQCHERLRARDATGHDVLGEHVALHPVVEHVRDQPGVRVARGQYVEQLPAGIPHGDEHRDKCVEVPVRDELGDG